MIWYDVLVLLILAAGLLGIENFARQSQSISREVFTLLLLAIVMLIGIFYFVFRFVHSQATYITYKQAAITTQTYTYMLLSNKKRGYASPHNSKQAWEWYQGKWGIQKFLAAKTIPKVKKGVSKVYTVLLNRFKQAKRSKVAQRHINVKKLS